MRKTWHQDLSRKGDLELLADPLAQIDKRAKQQSLVRRPVRH